MSNPVTLTWDAPDPSTCEHPRMVDGVIRVTATPLGASGKPTIAEKPARQCARCRWVNGSPPCWRAVPAGVPHQIHVGFVPNPPKGPTMTNFTHDWIAKREQLEQAAAPGPWHWEPPSGADWPMYDESLVTEDGNSVLVGWGYDASGIEGAPADREFIAAARTSLPAALAALKAVLAIDPMPNHLDMQPRDRDYADGHNDALRLVADAVEAALRGDQ